MQISCGLEVKLAVVQEFSGSRIPSTGDKVSECRQCHCSRLFLPSLTHDLQQPQTFQLQCSLHSPRRHWCYFQCLFSYNLVSRP